MSNRNFYFDKNSFNKFRSFSRIVYNTWIGLQIGSAMKASDTKGQEQQWANTVIVY